MQFLPALGSVGLAGALTALLLLGTSTGGRMKQLGWGACLVLSMIAGSAYKAAGAPFDLVSSFVHDSIGLFADVFPGYSLAAIGLTLVIVIFYMKLTTRGVSMLGIFFWYVAADAGGSFGVVADKIAVIMQSLAT
ncbi:MULTISPECIES: hypothetical protein [unclassified Streptomyces]|uniref:hypothetical protein n=1 Tax=unclassified Streptomyces TaxID=2593676 RepID=UPI00202512D7|nr:MULTISPECIES: hypothetical protein [unclassified Streptomyces]MCX4550556.1 hypothetical protein [Streptomyces sp. NBC_01500]WSC22003.1 hypothetical protein OIE60_21245 [Streptomyces sp. NBC_01766]